MTPSPPTKVLIVAPNASSRFGGETFLPLKYFEILRRRGLPAKLIAHARNRADLSETLAPFLPDVPFVEDTAWHRGIWKLGRPFPNRIHKTFFGTLLALLNSHFQARLGRDLIAQGKVDLIHEPVPGCARPLAALTPPRCGQNMTGKGRWTGCWRFTPEGSEADPLTCKRGANEDDAHLAPSV